MITVAALFTKNSGQPATGLTLSDISLYLYSRNNNTGAVATVWNGEAPTDEVGAGVYAKSYTGEDEETYTYFGYAQYAGATSLDSNYSTSGVQASNQNAKIEGSLTERHVMRVLLASAAGKATGGNTTGVAFRDQADSKDRIVMTVDSHGDRSSVTVDGT